jgi:hypothetical protein
MLGCFIPGALAGFKVASFQKLMVAGTDLRLACWLSLPQGFHESNVASVGAKSTFTQHARISLHTHHQD